MNMSLTFVVAMVVTVALVPLLARWAGALKVLDAPGLRKIHDVPIPRIGGIAMFAGIAVSLLPAVATADAQQISYFLAAGVIFLFGVWDDRVDLPPKAKFAGQVLAIAIVIGVGGITIDSYTLTERMPLPHWFSILFTALFILGVTNAINLSDGLDGLAGGTTLLMSIALAMLAITAQVGSVAIVAMAVAGSILGFLRFNTYPARVFMGDSGSQLLGFTVAVLTVMLTQRSTVPISTALPLMLLGLPVVDTLMVMSQRIREGSPLFAGDKRHIHHKLLGLGFDHHEAVVVIYAVQAVYFIAAWFLRYEPDPVILAIFTAVSLTAVGLLVAAGRLDWRWRRLPEGIRRSEDSTSRLKRAVVWVGQPYRLPRWAIRTAGASLILYMLAIGFGGEPASHDLVWLAVALSLILGCAMIWPQVHARADWLIRGSLYICATLVVFLDHVTQNAQAWLPTVKLILLPLLTICVIVRMRLLVTRFQLTTLDVLLIFAALVVPNLPGLGNFLSNPGLSIAKLAVLLYAVELFASQSERGQRVILVGAFAFLLVVVTRTLG